MKLYQKIASCLQAMENCRKSDNAEWLGLHEQSIIDLVREKMPSGSGWDIGTQLDFKASAAEKLVFSGSFHHMDDAGGYDGWTDHTITVTPSLACCFNMKISGRDRNGIKDHLHDVFADALNIDA